MRKIRKRGKEGKEGETQTCLDERGFEDGERERGKGKTYSSYVFFFSFFSSPEFRQARTLINIWGSICSKTGLAREASRKEGGETDQFPLPPSLFPGEFLPFLSLSPAY